MPTPRKGTRGETCARIIAWVPKEIHQQLVTLILLTNRSMTYYVTRGLKRVVSDAQRQWPAEYFFQTLEEKAAFAKSTSRYGRRRPQVSTAILTTG